MKFYSLYDHCRDKFEIIAIHNSTVRSMAELKTAVADVKERFWGGKDLPFPVVIDKDAEVENLFGIRGWPTYILVDPKGKVVGSAYPEELAKKLPSPPVSKVLNFSYDSHNNFSSTFTYQCLRFKEIGKRIEWLIFGDLKTEVDMGSLKKAGIDPERKVPLIMAGDVPTLRTREIVMLHAFGMKLVPDDQAGKIWIRADKRLLTNPFDSLRKSRVQRKIEKTVLTLVQKRKLPTGVKRKITADNLTLQQLIKAISDQGVWVNIVAVLDEKKFDHQSQRFSGEVDMSDVLDSLNQLLSQHHLKARVAGETILIYLTR